MTETRSPVARTGGVRLGGVDWRTESLLLALIAAETAVAWLVARLVLESDGVPVAALFVLLYGAAATPRALEALGVWDRGFAVGTGLAIAATTLVAIKIASFPHVGWVEAAWLRETLDALVFRPAGARVSVWAMVLVAAYAWWRGQRRAEPSLDAAHRTLRVGTAVVVVGVVAQAVGDGDDRAASGAVLAFFATALVAVVLARMRLVHERDPSAGLGTRRWVGPALVPVLAVLAVAVVTAGVFSRDLFDTVVLALSPLLWGIGVLVRVVVLIGATAVFIVLAPVLWLLDDREPRERSFPGPSGFSPPEALPEPIRRVAETPDPIRYLVVAAVLALLFGAATRFVLRWRRRRPVPAGEDRESVLDVSHLLAQWGGRLRRLLRGGGGGPDPLAALRGDSRWAHTVAIRETYRRLLRWSGQRGIVRETGTTPREHAADVGASLGGGAGRGDRHDDLALITARYETARYGAEPASAEDAAAVRAAWRRLRRSGDT